MSWQRPASVPYPSVWCTYVGKRPMPNGQFPQFRIQDAPEQMFDEIVDHMVNVFLKGEPICVNSNLSADPVSVAELKHVWAVMLQQKMALVALVEEEFGVVKLAGVNVTGISLVQNKDKPEKFEGVAVSKVIGAVEHMAHAVDVFDRYNVTEYMTAMGLSVLPEFRGQGLGLEMLLARIPLCKATGVKLTSTVFTAGNSQELARRAGFELLYEMEYKDYKVDGQEVFPGISTKYCKSMALKIE